MQTRRWGLILLGALVAADAVLIHLGRSYGSTTAERARVLAGDELITRPDVQTDHAVTIDAPPTDIWPWLVQMGWGRGGWYTARWVDRLLFPANGPSAERIEPHLQELGVGDFILDGPPDKQCGFSVVQLAEGRTLVLRSNSHLPARWRRRAALDWTWSFALTPGDDGGTRFHFRSRWSARPWWLTLGSWLFIVPADFLMSRDMLNGVKSRAETGR